MISLEIAANQVARLADLREFPKDPFLQNELVEALRHCDSEEHAIEVVSEWKHGNAFTPTQADLFRIIESTAKHFVPSCAQCNGLFFISYEQDGYRFSKPCPACRKPAASEPSGKKQKAGHQ